ncbi:392_t:CDS:2 [Cetraspora pellucida]|uniref:392_t:CDS:1 n=1 Tax=Cetraspora pellucida TaxID=1433469 RepID=A0A9N9GW57_9GLOM|nr:392_t:CDS:2 [Cetraspora pellucida]
MQFKLVNGSLVSRSLGIKFLIKTLGRGFLVNRTSVRNNISSYDSSSERRIFNTNYTNNNKRQVIDKLIEDFELIDLILQSSQTLSIANSIDLITEIQFLINHFSITNLILANNYIEADHNVETNVMTNDIKIINIILNHDCNEDDEVETKVCVFYKEIITNINIILQFIDKKDGFKVNGSFIKKLDSFKKDVVRDNIVLQGKQL